MKIIKGFDEALKALDRSGACAKNVASSSFEVEKSVRAIIEDVKTNGDKALLDYSLKFDGVKLSSVRITLKEAEEACNAIPKELLNALKKATENIRAYHQKQLEGIKLGVAHMEGRQLFRPIENVGVYAPGGEAFYPSTVLMTAIPAKVSGVKRLALATPPSKNGKIPQPTLAAAYLAGVDEIYAMGGAQAISALSYGTESVKRVDKICGPGNIYVATAKKTVFGDVGIDSVQGPSEVLVLADEFARADYCASEILAQAEHDRLAVPIMVTTSEKLAKEVSDIVSEKLETMKRQSIAKESINNHAFMCVVDTLEEAIALSNKFAPEHLCLFVKDSENAIDKIQNAGCVFTGEKAAVAIGDYVAGPSHALPTEGTARFSSPLNVNDFIKIIDIVNTGQKEIKEYGGAGVVIAEAEGLEAHADAIRLRLKD